MSKSISIRELLLLILVIALILGWRNAASYRHRVSKLEIETGHIRQDSKDVIYVRQLSTKRNSEWRFRVLVPEDANYQFVWSYQLADPKTPTDVVQKMDSAPLFLPDKVNCYEGQYNLTVYANNRSSDTSGREWTSFHYRGHPINEDLFIDAKVADSMRSKSFAGFINRSGFENQFGRTYDYDSGLHKFKLGETIQLLRLEGKRPDTGIDVWIELNMVPMSAAVVKARKLSEARSIPAGNAAMGSMISEAEDSQE